MTALSKPLTKPSGAARCALGWAVWAVIVLMLTGLQAAQAQEVTFSGRMGSKALLVINGQPRVVGVGEVVAWAVCPFGSKSCEEERGWTRRCG